MTGTIGTTEGLSSIDSKTLLNEIKKIHDEFQKIPPIPRYDLYGGPVGRCVEIKNSEYFDEFLPKSCKGRTVLVVPKGQLYAIGDNLRKAGIDVRIEPRIEDDIKMENDSEK